MTPTPSMYPLVSARSLIEAVPVERPAVGLSVAVGGTGSEPDAHATGLADASSHRVLTPATMLHACSMSKLVAAVTVLRLAELGAVDLDADVDTCLRSWALPRAATVRAPVTLAQLLSHQAGIVDPEDVFTPVGSGVVPDVQALLRDPGPHRPGSVTVSRPPGERFGYSDAGYCVIEQVVRDVTEQPYAVAVDDLVLGPLGLAGSSGTASNAPTAWSYLDDPADDRPWRRVGREAAVGHAPDGTVVPGERAVYPGLAAAGLWATPTALARLLTDLLGAWHGETLGVLRPASVRTLWSAPGKARFAALGAFLFNDARGAVIQTHGWGQGFQGVARVHLPARSVVVSMMCSDPGVDQDASAVGAVADTWAVNITAPHQ